MRFFVVFVLSLLTGACSRDNDSSLKILGGVKAEEKFLADLYLKTKAKTYQCSASYLTADAVITAAHCLLDDGKIAGPDKITVIPRYVKTPDKRPKVKKVIAHPHFDPSLPTHEMLWFDLALLVLDAPMPKEAVPDYWLCGDELKKGEKVEMFGAGYTETSEIDEVGKIQGDGEGDFHKGTNHIDKLDRFKTEIKGKVNFSKKYQGKEKDARESKPGEYVSTAYGDSGGPALLLREKERCLSGVISGGGYTERDEKTKGLHAFSYYTRIDPIENLSFMQQAVAPLVEEPKNLSAFYVVKKGEKALLKQTYSQGLKSCLIAEKHRLPTMTELKSRRGLLALKTNEGCFWSQETNFEENTLKAAKTFFVEDKEEEQPIENTCFTYCVR